MPPLLLADSLPPADANWGMQAIVWISLAVSLATGLIALRRKPSVDVDVTQLQNKYEAAKQANQVLRERQEAFEVRVLNHIGIIHNQLNEGAKTHATLTQGFTDVKQDISELSGRVTAMPEHIVDLLKVFIKPK